VGVIEYEKEEAEIVLAAVRTASSGSCPQPPDTMDGTSDGGGAAAAADDALQCIDPGVAALKSASGSILDDLVSSFQNTTNSLPTERIRAGSETRRFSICEKYVRYSRRLADDNQPNDVTSSEQRYGTPSLHHLARQSHSPSSNLQPKIEKEGQLGLGNLCSPVVYKKLWKTDEASTRPWVLPIPSITCVGPSPVPSFLRLRRRCLGGSSSDLGSSKTGKKMTTDSSHEHDPGSPKRTTGAGTIPTRI
jgi:hypothetical protein